MTVVARVENEVQVHSSDAPQDFVTNTMYFATEGTPGPSDWTALVNNVNQVFSGNGVNTADSWPGRKHTTIAYDMADALPRPEKAVKVHTPITWETSGLAPRQVAYVLSYFGSRNLKRQRGRIYLGPWLISNMAEHPSSDPVAAANGVAHGLANIATLGSLAWVHTVYSHAALAHYNVTDYWWDDRWDTQRRRLSKAGSRTTYHP